MGIPTAIGLKNGGFLIAYGTEESGSSDVKVRSFKNINSPGTIYTIN